MTTARTFRVFPGEGLRISFGRPADDDAWVAAVLSAWHGERLAHLRDAVAEYLSRNGFLVRAAGDAAVARTLLAEQPADVVLLDLSMPGEDGLSLARWMRTQPACPGIIMVTAASDLADRVVGLEIGADDYLGKPFALRELLARVRALSRRLLDARPRVRDAATRRVAMCCGRN